MIYKKPGEKFSYEDITYTVGNRVLANEASEYSGLFGRILEIRTDDDRETENDTPDILSTAFIKAGLVELLLFIIRCKEYEDNVIKEIDVDNRKIQEVATYIFEHYTENILLEDVADKFDMNKSFLSKRFKTATGFGFKEYIINLRIQNACRLLLETNKSITDIAFECGFNDSNYFGDSFRKIKGISPRKYRKNETF